MRERERERERFENESWPDHGIHICRISGEFYDNPRSCLAVVSLSSSSSSWPVTDVAGVYWDRKEENRFLGGGDMPAPDGKHACMQALINKPLTRDKLK